MPRTTRKHVVVLGAGLGGLSAAWVLGRSGHAVTLLEKSDHPGGLAVTKRRDGFEYDLGPHNIHTVHEHVLSFLRRNLGGSLFEHAPKSKILKGGKLIDYPLRGSRVISSLAPWRVPLAGASFLAAHARMFLRRPSKDDSFRAWITNRFGPLLFQEYFGPYAEKVWGIPSDQIDKYVAEKRVPVIGIVELVRAALFGESAGDKHPEFLEHNYYLRHGIGETVDFFTREIERLGVRVRYDAAVRRIETDGDRVRRVAFSAAGEAEETLDADEFLSTIPLNELVPLVDAAPPEVREIAAALDYCSAVLVFLEVSRARVLPSEMLYFSDPRVRFSRVYDVGMYSQAMVPAGKALLCVEFPCSAGDAIWAGGDEALAREVEDVLVESGVLARGQVEGAYAERITHTYPRFRLGFQERVARCFEFLRRYRNLISYGRQGSFAYLNVDGVMNQGFKAASAIILAESTGYPCWEWFETR